MEYYYDDLTYVEKKDFAELKIFEQALNSISRYYNEEERKLRELLTKNTITSEQYRKRSENLKEQRRAAQKLANDIQTAMAEYKKEVRNINALQNEKIRMLMGLIQDNKVIKVFSEENKKIRGRKLEAKASLVKALESKYLRQAMTAIRVDNSSDRMKDVTQAAGNYVVGSSEGSKESLGDIVEHLKASKIANEFTAKAEMEQIKGQADVHRSFEEAGSKSTILGTSGNSLYVNDEEYKTLKNGGKEYLSEADEKVGMIDTVIRSNLGLESKNTRKLQVTKEEYLKLANVNLEYRRVEEALSFMERNQIFELYPRTRIMLTEYRKRLLEQQKKLTISAANKATSANLDSYAAQIEREEKLNLFEGRKRHLELEIEKARDLKDFGRVQLLEEELRAHIASFDTIYMTDEQSKGR